MKWSGNRVRIISQLVQTSDGTLKWSQTYDRELGDVLTVQSEIATAVAGAMRSALRGWSAPTATPVSFDAYQRNSENVPARQDRY